MLGVLNKSTREKWSRMNEKLRQTTLTANITLKEKVELCHSRIPQARFIEGFLDSNLIAPLPIWSPVPKEPQKTAHDSFSIWGLEAQHAKYLPEILQPFVRVETQGKGHSKHAVSTLLEGAYKHSIIFSFNGKNDSKDLEKFQRVRAGHYDEKTDVITIYLDTIAKSMLDDFGHLFAIPKIVHGQYSEPILEQNPVNLTRVFCSIITHEYIHHALWLLGLESACRQYDHKGFFENVECEEVDRET